MTFIKDAVDKIRGKKKGEENIENKLERIGLSFMSSQETKERIERKKELFEILYSPLKGRTPEAKIKDLHKKVNKINMILHETDVPYGRGGERGWYSEVVFAWTDIYAISNIFIESTMRQIEKANFKSKQSSKTNQPVSLDRLKRRKETLLINIEHFYIRITRAYAEKVAACSWFPEDVGRNWAAIINTFKDKPQREINRGHGYNVYREGGEN